MPDSLSAITESNSAPWWLKGETHRVAAANLRLPWRNRQRESESEMEAERKREIGLKLHQAKNVYANEMTSGTR